MAREEYYHQNIIEIVLLRYEEREIIRKDISKYYKKLHDDIYDYIQKFEDDVILRIQEFEENPEDILTKEFLSEGTDNIVDMLISSFIINTPFIINTSDKDAELFVGYIEDCINWYQKDTPFPVFPDEDTPFPAFPDWLLKEIADIHFDNLFYFGPCKDVSREGLIWYNDNWSDRRDTCIDVLKSLLPLPSPPVAAPDPEPTEDTEMPDAPAPPFPPVAAPPSPPETPGGQEAGKRRAEGSQSQEQTQKVSRTTGTGSDKGPSLAAGELFGSPFGRKLDKTKGWWVELKKDKKCEMGVKFVRVKNFRKYRYGVHVDPEYFEKMTGASFWDLPLYRCAK